MGLEGPAGEAASASPNVAPTQAPSGTSLLMFLDVVGVGVIVAGSVGAVTGDELEESGMLNECCTGQT